jgi:hypothetical protein
MSLFTEDILTGVLACRPCPGGTLLYWFADFFPKLGFFADFLCKMNRGMRVIESKKTGTRIIARPKPTSLKDFPLISSPCTGLLVCVPANGDEEQGLSVQQKALLKEAAGQP